MTDGSDWRDGLEMTSSTAAAPAHRQAALPERTSPTATESTSGGGRSSSSSAASATKNDRADPSVEAGRGGGGDFEDGIEPTASLVGARERFVTVSGISFMEWTFEILPGMG